MNILAIETSSEICSIAILKNGVIDQKNEFAPQQHGRFIIPTIESLLSKHKLQLKDLHAIAYGSGPGSFTGLRIGISIVQGLALAADLAVIAISSMRAIAQQVLENYDQKAVLICKDARMQEVYLSGYQLNEKTAVMDVVIPESVTKPQLMTIASGTKWSAVGEGWTLYPELTKALIEKHIPYLPDKIVPEAQMIAKIASLIFSDEILLDAQDALPSYLRQSDSWKKIDQQ